MKKTPQIIIVLAIVAQISYLYCREQDKSNLQIMEQLISGIIQTAFQNLPAADSSAFIIFSPMNAQRTNWLVEKEIIQWTRSRGIGKVYQADSSMTPSVQGYQVMFQPVEFKVSYNDDGSLPSGTTERNITGSVFIKTLAPDNRILLAQNFSQSYKDAVRAEHVSRFEDNRYPFTIAKKKARGFFNAFMEPFLVTAASGGIIYIFYSFRSK